MTTDEKLQMLYSNQDKLSEMAKFMVSNFVEYQKSVLGFWDSQYVDSIFAIYFPELHVPIKYFGE